MSRILLTSIILLAASCVIFGGYNYGNIPSVFADSTLVQMNDTTTTFGLSAYSGRPVQTEFVSSTSSLVGKSIDTVVVDLQRNGAPTGTVQVGVFNMNLSVKQLFGTIDASNVATNYAKYSFSLPSSQTYQIQSGDRIGIKFAGGDTSNLVAIMTDQSNSFDGGKSYLKYYTGAWQSFTGQDISMALELHVSGSSPTVSASPSGGTYSSPQSVILTASSPSTIFYTTDGSTPTTSSTSGTSPITGITINTNSTLKFFAKDSLGNVSPIVSDVYTIISTPTVSASPPGGTYSSPPSVTLAASLPSTIYYTIDGSTPTTSSTSGPSPVSITINTNSTLKFFAKDSLGNVSPIVSDRYTIVSPPTVSASPPGGTYNSTQSVTLAASSPSTIYYTIDGSTPTTSSTSGSSPVSITVNTNSTLKFFAKDVLGISGPTVTQTYVIKSQSITVDPFGITKLYPDSPGGMQWYSTTFNIPRTNTGGTVDSVDKWLDFSHGDGNYAISNGILSATPKYSASPIRIYIHNPNLQTEWHNVEITTYGRNDKMDASIPDWSWSGLMAYGRTTHGANGNEDINLCDDRGYGGRLKLDGNFDFEKETAHHLANGYDQKAAVPVWAPSKMPLNQWIGYKFVIYDKTVNGVNGVQLEMWLDKSGTGNWVKISSYFDNGSNFGLTGSGTACASGVNPKLQLTHSMALINSETGKPHLSVYYRTDGQWMSYKDMSVREIIAP